MNPEREFNERRAFFTLTIDSLIAVLRFGLTCLTIGYSIGRGNNYAKIAAQLLKLAATLLFIKG